MAAAASEAVAHLPEGPLRDALAALGRAVLSESPSRLEANPVQDIEVLMLIRRRNLLTVVAVRRWPAFFRRLTPRAPMT